MYSWQTGSGTAQTGLSSTTYVPDQQSNTGLAFDLLKHRGVPAVLWAWPLERESSCSDEYILSASITKALAIIYCPIRLINGDVSVDFVLPFRRLRERSGCGLFGYYDSIIRKLHRV